MGALVFLGFIGGVVAITVLGYRWTRPRPSAPDLQRADAAQSERAADAKTVRERVFQYVTMYGPRR